MKTAPCALLTLCRVLPFALLSLSRAAAQTLQWDSDTITAGAQGAVTTAGWSSGTLWWDGTTNVAWTSGSDAVFGSSAGVVLNDAAVTVDDINFTVPGYVLQANGPDYGIRLGGGDGAHVISVAGNAAINCRLLGTDGFTKEGAGVLLLGSRNQSVIGTITINAGEVKVAGGFTDAERSVALANTPGAIFTVDGQDQIIGGLSGGGSAGGEVRINGSLILAAGTNDVTYAGPITGEGSFTKRGAGTLTLSTPISTYSGPTYIDEGILSINGLADAGTPGPLGLSDYIRMGAGTTLLYTGETTFSDRRLELLSTTTINVKSPGTTLTWAGRISGEAMIKAGPGTLLLSGSNTYAGSTTVSAGTLKVSGGNAIPDNSRLSLAASGTLNLAGSTETIAGLNGAGRIELESGILRTMGASTFSGSFSGPGVLEIVGRGDLTVTAAPEISELRISDGTLSANFDGGPLAHFPPVILGSATTSGTLAYPRSPYLLLTDPLTISAGGGTLRGSIFVGGPIEGTGELKAEPSGTFGFGSQAREFAGTLTIPTGYSLDSGYWPKAKVKIDATLVAPKSISVRALEVSGRISIGDASTAATISSGSLSLGGRPEWDLFNASASGYDHFEIQGPVRINTVTVLESLSLRLWFDPIDNVDVIRLVVNDESDPTVLEDGGGFVFGGRILQEGERFFLPRSPVLDPPLGPPQEFEIHYGLDSTDNDVRLVAVPESSSLLFLSLGLASATLCRPRRPGMVRGAN